MVRPLLAPALAAALVVALLPAHPGGAAPARVTLEDPEGDDRGPGGYLPPSSAYVHPGDFDLRRFELSVEGDETVIRVTLGRHVRRHVVAQRQGRADLDLSTDLVVQNIDLYLDTRPGEGFTEALPGRRVRFPEAQAWDTAIILTPQPQRLKALLRKAWPEADPRILVPYRVRALGATVEARLPVEALGGPPQAHWGYSVLVTGAVWDRSFDAFGRLTDAHAETGFVMPVYGVPEENAFGGAEPGGSHPWVIDVLLPEGTSQARVLGDHGRQRPALVPLVYPHPARHPAAKPPGNAAVSDDASKQEGASPHPDSPSVADAKSSATASPSPPGVSDVDGQPSAPASPRPPRISDLDGDTVVVAASGAEVNAFQLGHVLNDAGSVVARIVVTHVSDAFVVGHVVEGRDQLRVGARVRFNATPSSKESP